MKFPNRRSGSLIHSLPTMNEKIFQYKIHQNNNRNMSNYAFRKFMSFGVPVLKDKFDNFELMSK